MSSPRPAPFQRFLDEHREAVWRYLRASVGPGEADDCFQETFLSALRAYPKLAPDSNARAWVLTIAHHKAIDSHRARARRALPVGEIAEHDRREAPAVTARDPDLWAAVDRLPPRQRSAVILRHGADLPHRDIARVLGCSEAAARRSLHEAITRLREVITP